MVFHLCILRREILRKEDMSLHILSLLFKHRTGCFKIFAYNHWHVWLDDACFLTGNLCQRVAQKLGMVETDVGDDGKHWGDDVGAVESAAQSYLDYGVIYLLLGKVFQSHGSGQFEEGWMEGFEEASVLLYEVDDILLRNAFAVNSDTLSEIYEMRGGVETYLVSLTLQDGGDGMRA